MPIINLHIAQPSILLIAFIIVACSVPVPTKATSQEFDVKNISEADQVAKLQERCKELSENSEYEYHVVSGVVLHTNVVNPYDHSYPSCDLWEQCVKDRNATLSTFGVVMKPPSVSENDSSEHFSVMTKLEPFGDLRKKEPYMLEGKRYAFCAQDLGPSGVGILAEQERFQIDLVETIQELE